MKWHTTGCIRVAYRLY